jgi:PAS domain S-box-containing protein
MGWTVITTKAIMTNNGNEWILDRIHLSIQLFRTDGSILYQNDAAKKNLHQYIDSREGKQFEAENDSIEGEGWRTAFRTCVKTHSPAVITVQYHDEQRGVVWFEHRFDCVDEHVLVVSEDITEKKKAELAWQSSEGKFTLAFHSSPVGIAISLMEDGTFIEVNDTACRIYGYPREEIIGRTSVELGIIDADTRKRLLSEIKSKERLRAFELPLHSKSGELRTVLFSWEAIEFDNRSCVIATIVDITDMKKLEEQNNRLQRMESIGALAGGIVHDLNNVLGPMMLALGTLQRKLVNSEDRIMIDLLQKKSRQAADLVRQILTFARGSQTSREPVQLSRITDEVLSMIKPTFPANITVEKQFPTDLKFINADATQLIQVILNLLVNARDAMPNGGTIRIEGENIVNDPVLSRMSHRLEPGEYVLLKVTDNGAGMTPEVKERIFNPFFTTKESGKGTGLGLSTVASIVKTHNGEVQVISEPGRGTEFRIFIPVERAEQTKNAFEPTAVASRGNGELILFVDDDAIVREVVKLSLEAGGYRTLTAPDGFTAISLFGKDKDGIAVVVTDLDLPQMDGYMLTVVLRKMNPSIRIIGSSGTPDNEGLRRFKTSGINGFLPKPYTSETLLSAIHSVLTLHSSGNELRKDENPSSS